MADLGLLVSGPDDAEEALLFLHGWGGSKELWHHTLDRLAGAGPVGRFRCLAVDLPGTGGTPLPGGLETMPQMAAWVADTCARLGIESVTLVGHSLGGNLAAQTALDFPALVRRLVLVDAALDPSLLPPRSRWPLHARWGLPALRVLRLGAGPLAGWGGRVPPPDAAGFWRGQARRTHWYVRANPDDRLLRLQLRALSNNPLLPARLSALAMPTLILHGARDPVVPAASARALADVLPGARLQIFPNALHCPMDTDPDGFVRAIAEFAGAAPAPALTRLP